MSDGIAIGRQRPMEIHVAFQIEKVVAVAYIQPDLYTIGVAQHNCEHGVCHRSTRIIVAQLIIVGQRHAVGIQQTVCAFVAKHLESAGLEVYTFSS